jgi:FtsH-binding integral membrane protein
VPYNYFALFTFTISYGLFIAATCGIVYNIYLSNGAYIVLASSLMTLSVAVSLCVYAYHTKTDFTVKGGILWVIVPILMVLAIYGFYLIFDMQLIIGDKVS